jgi:hypothetical protein
MSRCCCYQCGGLIIRVLKAAAAAWLQVKPDSSAAQRSAASGHLLLTMPKEEPGQAAVDVTYLRQA